mmetsp:Transcript_48297/g.111956  ORF Transcript_48297/g.111956 Transcript_48297/m.111956 type:complete len:127 (+) Transcript_48297:713-1093(+)
MLRRSVVDAQGRPATTELLAVSHFSAGAMPLTLAALRIHTGRTHQIRVHFSSLGHPLLCDGLYGAGAFAKVPWCPRLFLHAHRVRLEMQGEALDVALALPPDLKAAGQQALAVDEKARLAVVVWWS